MWVWLGRTFNGKRIYLKTSDHCISVQQWIGMDLPGSMSLHSIQGNLVGNAQLFAKSGNIIFLDFERDVVTPCFSWFQCLFMTFAHVWTSVLISKCSVGGVLMNRLAASSPASACQTSSPSPPVPARQRLWCTLHFSIYLCGNFDQYFRLSILSC